LPILSCWNGWIWMWLVLNNALYFKFGPSSERITLIAFNYSLKYIHRGAQIKHNRAYHNILQLCLLNIADLINTALWCRVHGVSDPSGQESLKDPDDGPGPDPSLLCFSSTSTVSLHHNKSRVNRMTPRATIWGWIQHSFFVGFYKDGCYSSSPRGSRVTRVCGSKPHRPRKPKNYYRSDIFTSWLLLLLYLYQWSEDWCIPVQQGHLLDSGSSRPSGCSLPCCTYTFLMTLTFTLVLNDYSRWKCLVSNEISP